MDKININQILTEEEQITCKESFDAYNKTGYGLLSPQELQSVLEELGEKPSMEDIQKMISEVDRTNKGYIDYQDFIKAVAQYKLKERQNENENNDTQAFVAMGGLLDKSGNIDTSKLIQVIKDEFNMTIDIERLILEIDHDKSGFISYDEFKTLLSK